MLWRIVICESARCHHVIIVVVVVAVLQFVVDLVVVVEADVPHHFLPIDMVLRAPFVMVVDVVWAFVHPSDVAVQ